MRETAARAAGTRVVGPNTMGIWSAFSRFSTACHTRPELSGMMSTLFDHLVPQLKTETGRRQSLAEDLKIMVKTVPVILFRRGGW